MFFCRSELAGRLVHCDFCPLAFHMDCVNPPLTTVPSGMWMCPNHAEHAEVRSSCFDNDFVKCSYLSDVLSISKKYFWSCCIPSQKTHNQTWLLWFMFCVLRAIMHYFWLTCGHNLYIWIKPLYAIHVYQLQESKPLTSDSSSVLSCNGCSGLPPLFTALLCTY